MLFMSSYPKISWHSKLKEITISFRIFYTRKNSNNEIPIIKETKGLTKEEIPVLQYLVSISILQ